MKFCLCQSAHKMFEPTLYSDGIKQHACRSALLELTLVEEMLVLLVMRIMSVYRLPHGQLGYGSTYHRMY